jgi:hypothetical protein
MPKVDIVPVYHCDEDAAADDVAEGGGDHALPDVVGNRNVWVFEENLVTGQYNAPKLILQICKNVQPKGYRTYWQQRDPIRAVRRRRQATKLRLERMRC